MFTGIVEAVGTLRGRSPRGPGQRVTIEAPFSAYQLGESIAVGGACLTVVAFTASSFDADVSRETVERTALGRVPLGGRVNLERSLALGARLGGHLVTGHVDATAPVLALIPAGEALRVRVGLPPALAPLVAEKGSITIDGVSLTVNAVAPDAFEVMLVPHTRAVTTLSELAPGREVNLEVDLVARYVARWLSSGAAASPDAALRAALEAGGFTAR